jgi:hypothetical protein
MARRRAGSAAHGAGAERCGGYGARWGCRGSGSRTRRRRCPNRAAAAHRSCPSTSTGTRPPSPSGSRDPSTVASSMSINKRPSEVGVQACVAHGRAGWSRSNPGPHRADFRISIAPSGAYTTSPLTPSIFGSIASSPARRSRFGVVGVPQRRPTAERPRTACPENSRVDAGWVGKEVSAQL